MEEGPYMKIYGTLIYYFLNKEEAVVELQHLLHLHLMKAAIRVGLLMGIVMMSTIILPASMMAVIAVDLMLILNIVMNVSVMNKFGNEVMLLAKDHLL